MLIYCSSPTSAMTSVKTTQMIKLSARERKNNRSTPNYGKKLKPNELNEHFNDWLIDSHFVPNCQFVRKRNKITWPSIPHQCQEHCNSRRQVLASKWNQNQIVRNNCNYHSLIYAEYIHYETKKLIFLKPAKNRDTETHILYSQAGMRISVELLHSLRRGFMRVFLQFYNNFYPSVPWLLYSPCLPSLLPSPSRRSSHLPQQNNTVALTTAPSQPLLSFSLWTTWVGVCINISLPS